MTNLEDEFVERSVAHQIGVTEGIEFASDPAARQYAWSRSSGMALAWDVERRVPFALNGWDGSTRKIRRRLAAENDGAPHDKTLGALREILDAGARGSITIDMQDRRVRSVVSPDRRGHPVYCFNRLKGEAGRVLWPLPGYHDQDSDDFLGNLDPCRIDWSAKSECFAWRGIVGGRANPQFDVRREGERLRPLLKKLEHGEIDQTEATTRLLTFPRFRFVHRYLSDGRADVGFVDGNRFALGRNALLRPYQKPRIPRQEFQSYKYLVVLRGLDVGSSFYWTMNSGSLGLVMQTPFESFASIHFEPWVHYVPFKEDLSDFEENLDWCQSHQGECQEMTRRAESVCKLLARADLRARVLCRVVAEVNRLTGQ